MGIPVIDILIILVALVFEFINGFHDTANAVATSVSTKSLEPFQAISIAAIFNLVGALSGTAVAITIAQGFALPIYATSLVILSALLTAIVWNLLTWMIGIPSSSSHALIGGLIGAIGFNVSFAHVHYMTLIFKVLLPMVVSPILGFFVAGMIAIGMNKLLLNNDKPRKTNNFIREIQVLSTAFLSFSHGTNDAQKTMGIITLALFNAHFLKTCDVPDSVILICAVCMALGTLTGGMRIIKTLSSRVAKLNPASGFAAEISSAAILLIGARCGMPLSTTHAVSGSIMGAGTTCRFGLNWAIVRKILIAWILTIPVCIILAGFFVFILHFFGIK